MGGVKGFLAKHFLAQESTDEQQQVFVESKYSQGIASNGSTAVTSAGRGAEKEARIATITFWTRLFALFSFFIALCLAIALTTFQKKWVGAPSGLSGFLLFCIITFLLVLSLLTLTPILADRSQGKKIAHFERALREDRVGFILMGWMLIVGFLISLTQMVSSLVSKACKDPAADPHATSSTGNDEDYVKALGSFCGTKRATAAFLWMGWLASLGLTIIFLLNFRQSRKAGPRIPPFVHPGGGSEGTFQAIDGEDDDERGMYGKPRSPDEHPATYRGYDEQYRYSAHAPAPAPEPATPAPPGSYRNPVSDVSSRYGMTQPHNTSHVTYDPVQAQSSHGHSNHGHSNPFADAIANAQPLLSRPPVAPAYDQYNDSDRAYEGYGGYAGDSQQAYVDPQTYQRQYADYSYHAHAHAGYAEQEYQHAGR